MTHAHPAQDLAQDLAWDLAQDLGHDRVWLRSWPGLVEAPIGARGTGTTPAGSPSAQ